MFRLDAAQRCCGGIINVMTISEIQGAIFDVDDTLLDNRPGAPGQSLHERTRLQAIQEVGVRYGIPELVGVTVRENLDAFLTAPIHSLPAAVWNYLHMKGLVSTPEIEPANKLFREIVDRKNELHLNIMRREAVPVDGAVDFVRSLAANGLESYLAIASSAIRPEVDLFLSLTGLERYFSDSHRKTFETVAHTKPHPEVYNLAFASLGLPEVARSSVLAFEDDPRGIMSAKAAGLRVCAITTRYPKAELQALEVAPDLVADSFAQFSKLLQIPPTEKTLSN